MCQENDAGFGEIVDAAATLTPYATMFRYPSDLIVYEPELTDALEAMALAGSIVERVQDRLKGYL